jgi:hypothetical protein
MMKTTTKRPSKAQIAREQIAKDERLRILWIINDMIFESDYNSDALYALSELHKRILDSSK